MDFHEFAGSWPAGARLVFRLHPQKDPGERSPKTQTRGPHEAWKRGKKHFLKISPGLRPGPRLPALPFPSFLLFPSLPPSLSAFLLLTHKHTHHGQTTPRNTIHLPDPTPRTNIFSKSAPHLIFADILIFSYRPTQPPLEATFPLLSPCTLFWSSDKKNIKLIHDHFVRKTNLIFFLSELKNSVHAQRGAGGSWSGPWGPCVGL